MADNKKRKQEIQLTKDDIEKGLEIDDEEREGQAKQAQQADEETIKQRKKFKIKRQINQGQPEVNTERKNPFANIKLVPQPQPQKQQQKQALNNNHQSLKSIPSTETIIQTNISKGEVEAKLRLEQDTQKAEEKQQQGTDTDSVNQIPHDKDTLPLDQSIQIQSTPKSKEIVKDFDKQIIEKGVLEPQNIDKTIDKKDDAPNTGFSGFSTFGRMDRTSFGQPQGDSKDSVFKNFFNTPAKDHNASRTDQNGFQLSFPGGGNSIFNLDKTNGECKPDTHSIFNSHSSNVKLNSNNDSSNNNNNNNNDSSSNINNATPGAFSLFSNMQTPNSTLTETKPQQLKVQFDKNFIQKTGEEDEDILFKGEGSLFTFGEGQQWKSRGTGEIHIGKDKVGKCRVVIRQKGSHRVILNAKLWSGMKLQYIQNSKSVTFSCVNFAQPPVLSSLQAQQNQEDTLDDKIKEDETSDAQQQYQLETYAIRIKNNELMKEFIYLIEKNKDNTVELT